MRTMKHLALAAMAATALALAGCGGGGGSTAGPTTPTDPAPVTPASVTLPSDGNMYLPDADTMLEDGTHSLAAGASTTLGAYMLSCSDAGPCEITIADGEVTATGEVTAAYTATAKAAITAGQKVAAAELKDRATGLASALADVSGGWGVAIHDPGTPAAQSKGSDFEVSRGLTGDAMISNGGKSGWETNGAAVMALSGWTGKVLTNGKTQSYTVYTDIAAAKRKAYDKAYSNDGTTETIPKVLSDAIAADNNASVTDVAVAETTGVLTLTPAGMTVAANAELLDPAQFPQPKAAGKGSNTYTFNDAPTKNASSFKGTFHGASGTYHCVATTPACTVSVTAPSTTSGPVYTAAAGNWTFTPDTKNNPQIVAQDADHMHFGWWIDDPAKRAVGDEFLYDAQVFYGGSNIFPAANIAALLGDATYTGPAAGLYAVTANAAKEIAAAHGEFTATATLTAKFLDDDGTNLGSVSGKVGSFVRDDGVANDWALALMPATIGATGASTTGKIQDGSKVTGGWRYQLYGPGTAGANPTGIAGAFNATIGTNVTVAGGFGAK